MDLIVHRNSESQRAIIEYCAAVEGGRNILICPERAYPGMDRVAALLASLTTGGALATDLRSRPLEPSAAHAADAPLLGYHTSGSTGQPKVVIYRRETVTAHARVIARTLRLDDRFSFVALPPVRFAYGLSILHSHLDAGIPVTFLDADWTLSGLARDASGRRLAVYMLPQHTPLLLSADLPADRVGRILIAGGRLSQTSADRLAQAFPDAQLDNMYGQAEMGPRLSRWAGPLSAFREGTIGGPLPGVELRLAEGTGPRDLQASSEFAMWKTIRHPYEQIDDGPGTGLISTGDLGEMDSAGSIVHRGRADRILNVAGTKVDLEVMTSIIERAFQPLAVRVTGRPAKVSGDSVPVVEIVAGRPIEHPNLVRRVLHKEFGSLASLVDLHLVEQLNLGESGK